MEEVARTETDTVEAERLAQEAVELPHAAQCGACPAICGNARLRLFPERGREVGVCGDVVERVGGDLEWVVYSESVSAACGKYG